MWQNTFLWHWKGKAVAKVRAAADCFVSAANSNLAVADVPIAVGVSFFQAYLLLLPSPLLLPPHLLLFFRWFSLWYCWCSYCCWILCFSCVLLHPSSPLLLPYLLLSSLLLPVCCCWRNRCYWICLLMLLSEYYISILTKAVGCPILHKRSIWTVLISFTSSTMYIVHCTMYSIRINFRARTKHMRTMSFAFKTFKIELCTNTYRSILRHRQPACRQSSKRRLKLECSSNRPFWG